MDRKEDNSIRILIHPRKTEGNDSNLEVTVEVLPSGKKLKAGSFTLYRESSERMTSEQGPFPLNPLEVMRGALEEDTEKVSVPPEEEPYIKPYTKDLRKKSSLQKDLDLEWILSKIHKHRIDNCSLVFGDKENKNKFRKREGALIKELVMHCYGSITNFMKASGVPAPSISNGLNASKLASTHTRIRISNKTYDFLYKEFGISNPYQGKSLQPRIPKKKPWKGNQLNDYSTPESSYDAVVGVMEEVIKENF